jgi:hypothetical protein
MNTMNESTKTIGFVAAATLMAATAVGSHFLNRPTNSADFELVGQPFFEEFDSASQAQSLEVAAVDADSARLKRFSVKKVDGLWRIPSHNNYPAEAAARLATTATSVMGIRRDSLAGRLKNEHERLGVMDPLSEDIEDPESVGKRITMRDAEDEVVVDFIIGKEAGDVVLSETDRPFGNGGSAKYYYVRRPDEQQTYKVKLDIDLSTKFSDWIDPDLLRIARGEITKVSIDNYKLEEDRSNPLARTKALFKSQGDKIELARTTSTDDWKLADLNAETEELQTAPINSMLGVVDELKIAGVRPKLKYKGHLLLTSDLKLNSQPEFEKNPTEFGREINRLQNQLDQKGFSLAGSAKKMELVASNGDLHIGTDKGVIYTMHVGKAVEGSEDEIEIGMESSDSSASETEAADSKSSDGKEDPETKEADASDASTESKEDNADDGSEDKVEEAKNRYLMIRVSFDQSLIQPQPDKPIEPVAPVAPEGYEPPKPETETEETKTEKDAKPDAGEANSETGDDDAPKPPPQDEAKPERNPEFVKHDEALIAFEQQKIDFELAKTQFETDTKAFAEKVAEGEALVKELNERFGDWYYVITGDNLNTLQTTRAELVKEKEKPASERVLPPRPDIKFPALPSENPIKAEPPLPEAAKEVENSTLESEMKNKADTEVDDDKDSENSVEENSVEKEKSEAKVEDENEKKEK